MIYSHFKTRISQLLDEIGGPFLSVNDAKIMNFNMKMIRIAHRCSNNAQMTQVAYILKNVFFHVTSLLDEIEGPFLSVNDRKTMNFNMKMIRIAHRCSNNAQMTQVAHSMYLWL